MKALRLSMYLLIAIPMCVHAQQQGMFTQYMFNGLALNPAYAGSQDAISMTAIARRQWVGIEGAPSTQTFSVHSPIRNQRMSLGLLALHDHIGVTDQTGAYASYAYRIPVAGGQLAFGLQGGLSSYHAEFSKVSVTDPAFSTSDIRLLSPTVGFGMYFNTKRFYAGLSVPQLNQTLLDKSNPDSNGRIIRHYFATLGYVFDLGPSFKLKPNLLVKVVEGAPVQFDVNANLLIREVVWVGVSWRSFDSVDALLQIEITPQFQLGYSYDFATSPVINRLNNGSHEIMLNYRFAFVRNKIISPRYF